MLNVLAVNVFFMAYGGSDFLGKSIFISLFALSVLSWAVIVHKLWLARNSRAMAQRFQQQFRKKQRQPLHVEYPEAMGSAEMPNPFYEVYQVAKQQAVEILSKNRLFRESSKAWNSQSDQTYLSHADLGLLEAHSAVVIADQTKRLEKHLFVLSTIMQLAPLLGLLGTVWGITITLGELQTHAMASTNQEVLSGLSMALGTTVLGLVVAIPALIGNSYLRHAIRDFSTEMENFSQEVLNAIEMHYRKVDVE